jgi:hypothetical protein
VLQAVKPTSCRTWVLGVNGGGPMPIPEVIAPPECGEAAAGGLQMNSNSFNTYTSSPTASMFTQRNAPSPPANAAALALPNCSRGHPLALCCCAQTAKQSAAESFPCAENPISNALHTWRIPFNIL